MCLSVKLAAVARTKIDEQNSPDEPSLHTRLSGLTGNCYRKENQCQRPRQSILIVLTTTSISMGSRSKSQVGIRRSGVVVGSARAGLAVSCCEKP